MNARTPAEQRELARKAANKRWENAGAKKKQASEKATSQIGGEMTVFLENWASTDNRESRS